ncbi:MAG: hypothetical protein AAF495_09270 [Pseudomonadota bacterium]
MTQEALAEIVDLERYPIDRLDEPAARDLVARCQEALAQEALCALPDFVRAEALAAMVAEAERLAPRAYRYDRPRIAYNADPSGWPADHPRSVLHPCRYNQVLNHDIPNDSPLRRLYLSPLLGAFLRRVLGFETLYISACPHLSLTLQFGGPGDCNGWHFDGNDVVFSLLLQAPERGGAFEVAPYIRSAREENYLAVEAVFADPVTNAQQPPLAPGTFTVFKGDLSLHRVSEIEGTRRRIIALFSYDRRPDQVFDQSYIEVLRSQRAG